MRHHWQNVNGVGLLVQLDMHIDFILAKIYTKNDDRKYRHLCKTILSRS